MAAPMKGNQFWKARVSHGRKLIFKTPTILWAACVEYFEWCEENPLQEEKVFHAAGVITHAKVNKIRAMTLGGLCIFLDVDQSTWFNYVRKKDFFKVTKKVDEIIRNQKFTGAAADLLNANIIARDLGLVDKKEHTGAGGGPVRVITSEMSVQEAAEIYADTLKDKGATS